MKKVSETIGCLIILSWIVAMFLVDTNECCEITAQEAAEIAVLINKLVTKNGTTNY